MSAETEIVSFLTSTVITERLILQSLKDELIYFVSNVTDGTHFIFSSFFSWEKNLEYFPMA